MRSVPLVSVIVVTWNSSAYLNQCFSALLTQTMRDFEIIVVDNGSIDNSIVELKSYETSLHLIVERLPSNLGFAVANNIGVRLAKGKWIVLLNADAFPQHDWLEELIQATEKNSEYNFFTSRQIQYNAPNLLDGAGDEYHISGLAWRRYYNYSEQEYGLEAKEVFGACAAAVLYRRDDFIAVGGFDEDYFSYFEDVDLSFRLRLRGGRCLYVPKAVVYHVGSTSKGKVNDFVIYYGHRNLVWTYFKNMPSLLFWLFLPLHLVMNLFFLISFTFKGKKNIIFKAKWDALLGMPEILKKRKEIQKAQTASLLKIYRTISKGLLEPYWGSRQRKTKITNRK